jgi:hypothetical protein
VHAERFFKLSPDAVSFDRRGIDCANPAVRASLEKILAVFVAGYNIALAARDDAIVAKQLTDTFDAHHVGFAYEGAGMCYALFDLLAPWSRSRLRRFTDGAGLKHDYIATVGAGFAVARVPWGGRLLNRYLHNLKATVAWCVIDGYGFHQGIFHPAWYTVECREAPARFPPYARQLFDSGVGRSLWWTQGASSARIAQAIDRFPQARRGEMWCGIGVAAAYAGGVEQHILDELLERSGAWRLDFLSGFPFAARMRQKGENASLWTERACKRLLGMSAGCAADLLVGHVDEVVVELNGHERALRERGYALLRRRLRGLVGRTDSRKSALVGVV